MKLRNLFSKKSKSDPTEDSKAESFDKAPLGTYVLHEGVDEIVADIVFVHGLRGHAINTWSKGLVCWPRDFLKNDIPNARIITWGYDSSVANALKYASKESIFGHSETLLGDMERLRRDKALIKSAAYQSHGRHPSLGEIYHNTKGVIFLGTPHRGSDKTDFANIIANVAKVSFRQPNKQLVGILSPDSDVLENQREQFTTITQNTPIVCIREELPTAIGVIVPEYSASMDGFNVRKDSIPANHMDMTKFSRANDIGYRRVSGHIVSLVQVQATKENKEIQKRMDDILEALHFETIDDREEKIERAHAETFNWILSDQSHCSTEVKGSSSIVPWLSKDTKPICWVSGKAGSGKSTLMKYIWTDERTRTHLSTWAGGKPLLLASFFFYERGGSFQKSREGLIRSLLHQILSQKRELIPIVFKDEFEIKEIKPPRFLSWPKLKNAFEILLTHTSDSFELCIFADGLDEYRIMDRMEDYTDDDFELFYDGKNDDESVWGRSHWIANGHREIAELFKVAASTTNVKICLSSRELTPFQGAFEAFPHLRLHNLTATDITIFTKTNFHSGIKSIPTVDETDGMDRLAEEIVLKAQGVFLWVRLVVDILIAGFNNGDTVPELRAKLESIPPRLGGKRGLYIEMLKNIDPEYRLQASRYIRLLLHAWNDLDLVDLEFAAEGPFGRKSSSNANLESLPDALIAVKAPFNLIPDERLEPRRKKMRLRLMSRCGGLLEAPKKHVRFMHQTVKEFFLREELWIHLLPQEPQSSFDPSLALLSACILRLKCLEELISKPYEGRYGEAYGRLYFGLDYIYTADSMHYAASSEGHGANKEAYFSLLDELDLTCTHLARAFFLRQQIQTGPIEECHWSTLEPMIDCDKKVSKYDGFLPVAIQVGLTSYVESKLSGGNISVGAKLGKPPLLAYAVSLDHGLPALVHYSSDNNAAIGYSLPDISVVRLLLSLGADTNEQYDGTTVWSEAVETGHKCFTRQRILFARGISRAGLIAQNKRRWIEVMKIMLRHGANPEEICHDAHGIAPLTAKEVIRDILKDSAEYSKDLVELEEIFKGRAVSVV
ncbi:hypothetical protein VE01_03650 [Pseudogymnoascus verrucosus]|uniref:NACHT domain-containing protein n=1 Tax=Pseudogymnoascus verrucosus TaxID=342668 RepID=A0A1B8GRS3_9PEZI|nr:uncharacterized protein VE01_03650 [Pseudogymnoascus verrucosus]OBT98500.1 hypothetical protein VE01_03650 [Pseudogymnoascus verrucosus]